MPRTRVTEETLYKFDELSDEAKDKAREWYREASSYDDFHEYVYEDAATIGAIMGLDIRQRPVKTMGGTTRYEPSILYTGFWSQGDGACFEGRWEYKPDALEKVKEYAPLDERLHAVAADFANEKVKGCWAEAKHRGRYCHEYSMDIDGGKRPVDEDEFDEYELPVEQYEHIKEMFADFARWIYKMLEAEYDYQNSNERVDENIQCNDYEFTEDGHIA